MIEKKKVSSPFPPSCVPELQSVVGSNDNDPAGLTRPNIHLVSSCCTSTIIIMLSMSIFSRSIAFASDAHTLERRLFLHNFYLFPFFSNYFLHSHTAANDARRPPTSLSNCSPTPPDLTFSLPVCILAFLSSENFGGEGVKGMANSE